MELYLRGFQVRGLADPRHWLSPLGAFFERFGSVKASPVAAARLLRQREAVLLFPGGAREVSGKFKIPHYLQRKHVIDSFLTL
jgi:hypothetical protein